MVAGGRVVGGVVVVVDAGGGTGEPVVVGGAVVVVAGGAVVVVAGGAVVVVVGGAVVVVVGGAVVVVVAVSGTLTEMGGRLTVTRGRVVEPGGVGGRLAATSLEVRGVAKWLWETFSEGPIVLAPAFAAPSREKAATKAPATAGLAKAEPLSLLPRRSGPSRGAARPPASKGNLPLRSRPHHRLCA